MTVDFYLFSRFDVHMDSWRTLNSLTHTTCTCLFDWLVQFCEKPSIILMNIHYEEVYMNTVDINSLRKFIAFMKKVTYTWLVDERDPKQNVSLNYVMVILNAFLRHISICSCIIFLISYIMLGSLYGPYYYGVFKIPQSIHSFTVPPFILLPIYWPK